MSPNWQLSEEGGSEDIPNTNQPASLVSEPSRFLSFEKLLTQTPARWALEDIIREGELGVLYGASTCGKSFLAVSMCLSIASGHPWFGKITIHGPIVYIASEGGRGLRKRVLAWMQEYPEVSQDKLQKNFITYNGNVAFLDDGFDAFLASLVAMKPAPVMVVVDTLANCMLGGDENSARDMGLFVEKARIIRNATGAAVLIIHHTTKEDPSKERGSGALFGAMDAMHLLQKTSDGALLTDLKQKDDETGHRMEFTKKKFVIGKTESGEEETSLVFCYKSDLKTDTDSNRFQTLVFQKILRCLFESAPKNGLSAKTIAEMADGTKTNIYYYINQLRGAGCIEIVKGTNYSTYRITEAGKAAIV